MLTYPPGELTIHCEHALIHAYPSGELTSSSTLNTLSSMLSQVFTDVSDVTDENESLAPCDVSDDTESVRSTAALRLLLPPASIVIGVPIPPLGMSLLGRGLKITVLLLLDSLPPPPVCTDSGVEEEFSDSRPRRLEDGVLQIFGGCRSPLDLRSVDESSSELSVESRLILLASDSEMSASELSDRSEMLEMFDRCEMLESGERSILLATSGLTVVSSGTALGGVFSTGPSASRDVASVLDGERLFCRRFDVDSFSFLAASSLSCFSC